MFKNEKVYIKTKEDYDAFMNGSLIFVDMNEPAHKNFYKSIRIPSHEIVKNEDNSISIERMY
jgi:hypothetical protein